MLVEAAVRMAEQQGKQVSAEELRKRRYSGQQLRRARKLAGLSQEELGRHVGVTGQAISDIETGKTAINATRFEQLADVLNQPVEFFYESPDPALLRARVHEAVDQLPPYHQRTILNLIRTFLSTRSRSSDM